MPGNESPADPRVLRNPPDESDSPQEETPREARAGSVRKWYRHPVSEKPEQFDAINFAGIALYKLGILPNLVPYVALRIVG